MFITQELEFIRKYYYAYLSGVGITVLLSIIGVVFGSVLGLLIAVMRLGDNKLLNKIAKIYIGVIRGTPLMVQLLIIFFGLKVVIPAEMVFLRNSILLCSIAIVVNSGAYIAEIFRGGINSVDKGQKEAARSLGLNKSQTMKEVILPQAIKIILPSLGNEFIALIKETAIVIMVGVPDIIYKATAIKAQTYKPIKPLVYAAICYLILTVGLSKLMGLWERSLEND
ncbi:amino acid ABC transporter permease [Peptoniphilus catoniae]|uniref:amino acid ABC transporter permease n=1 Tax=Peptoniphilus catoniae TaxID=1660341 RepID=UPI0010FE629C|nr:amino acid ABC transporter permease [Peptoniphilus catoniae]